MQFSVVSKFVVAVPNDYMSITVTVANGTNHSHYTAYTIYHYYNGMAMWNYTFILKYCLCWHIDILSSEAVLVNMDTAAAKSQRMLL